MSRRWMVGAVAGAALTALGCAERSDERRGSDAGDALRRVTLVQVGSFTDSANAHRRLDSLRAAGWSTRIMEARVEGARYWRVQLGASSDTLLPVMTAHAMRRAGLDAQVVSERVTDTTRVARAWGVNRGIRGMASRMKWALSEDRQSMIVVEDPAGVEAEALPNGFIFVSERGPLRFQRDSVWDVSPSPSWNELVYGRAYGLYAHEGVDITPGQWESLASRTGISSDSLRRASFDISAMNIARGIGQAVLVDLRGVTQAGRGERLLPVTAGWRVGWVRTTGESQGGAPTLVALGTDPARVQDDSPPTRWILVDAATGNVRGSMPPDARLYEPGWNEGPTLDVSIDVGFGTPRQVEISGGTAESAGGWVKVRGRVVGPGMLLASTATGRFLAVLAADPTAQEYDTPWVPLVYELEENW